MTAVPFAKSLSARLVVGVVAAVLAVQAVVFFFAYRDEEARVIERASIYGQIALIAFKSVGPTDAAGLPDGVAGFVAGMRHQFPELGGAEWTDQRGTVFDGTKAGPMVKVTEEATVWIAPDHIAAQMRAFLVRESASALVVALALVVTVIVVLQVLLIRPVAELVTALATDQPLPVRRREDEIGLLARAIEQARTGLREAAEAVRLRESETAAAQAERRAALTRLGEGFSGSLVGRIDGLAAEVSAMPPALQTVAAAAQATRDRAAAAVALTDRGTDIASTVAAASEELSATIAEISERTNGLATLLGELDAASTVAQDRIQGLQAASQRIDQVTALISEIAEQTNLLALNATIEAARAGDAGRGFAVVASEVKALAGQTARATEDIGREIATLRAAADDTAASSGAVLKGVVDASHIVAALAASATEQDAAVREVASLAAEIPRLSAEIADAAKRTDDDAVLTASELAGVASRVQRIEAELGAVTDAATRFQGAIAAA